MRGNRRGTMDLAEVLAICWQHGMVVALSVAVALVAGAMALWWIPPQYHGVTTLMVVKPDEGVLDYNVLLLNRNLAKTYVEVARSRSVAQQAVSELNLPMTPDQLRQQITVVTVRDTELITITVQSPDRELAAKIANTVAEAVRKQVLDYTRTDNLRVVDAADTPREPTNPQPVVVLGVSLVVGLGVGIGLAVLRERLRPCEVEGVRPRYDRR